ncbi:hypothetical protein L596_006932 [Steinernema carpocapsae]|uniref:glutathione transferase n=1 Tax=Steinernema carpocapsae TaxID=34508 RepID=A0A4U5P8D6_STECR|nr:hypothetical protein L596_006932 [Steinernema carpocapsae]
MVVYKLHYFEGLGGRVEAVRIILAYGNIPYEQVDIPDHDWPKAKSNYPNGQLPVLEEDGKMLTQSMAIARYFAGKLNLLGRNDWEAAQADAFIGTIEDAIATLKTSNLIQKLILGHGNDQTALEAADALRPFLERLEKHLLTTNGENLVGNHLTWADLAIADLYKRFSITIPHLLDGFPEVKKFTNHVYNLPGVKEYVAKRHIKNF